MQFKFKIGFTNHKIMSSETNEYLQNVSSSTDPLSDHNSELPELSGPPLDLPSILYVSPPEIIMEKSDKKNRADDDNIVNYTSLNTIILSDTNDNWYRSWSCFGGHDGYISANNSSPSDKIDNGSCHRCDSCDWICDRYNDCSCNFCDSDCDCDGDD